MAAAALTLSIAACSRPSSSGGSETTTAAATTTAAGSSGGSATSASGSDTGPATASSGGDTGEELSVGFFGFAKANSFAQATWAGVQEAAAANNATATFLDSNFDGPTQVNQLQDAVTSKLYDVVVIQANDGTAIVPAVKQALAAGITVVVEFTPIGGRYDTIEPQVDGVISIVDAPTINGEGLAEMALGACEQLAVQPCNVAYLQGFDNYPLDAARTKAAEDAIKAGGAELVASVIGGYTADSGRTAFQNVLQAHPDVNVVVGSSQAITGAAALAPDRDDLLFVGNGGSTQAFEGVMSGKWYGTYNIPEKTEGYRATEMGLAAHRGETVPTATDARSLTTYEALGTKENLTGQTADYSD
ncbi:substrate-binding domain-containing protein [Nakamurella sp. YIM 132087]|uniref:Substrate-binding domain-containing protein n=2 Tax=Nakamurella alba TaxID=2665158 RepID=A0A7K1FN60_9ACTN|nr:substrate-binding domain-containing protein [Nakamurella alba]